MQVTNRYISTTIFRYKGAWDDAIRTADILLDGCRWSKACYQYIRACCLYQKMIEENRPELLDEVVANMRAVPALKQRIAGKSIPIEKFVCKKSEKFIEQGNRLLLPAIVRTTNDIFASVNVYITGTHTSTHLLNDNLEQRSGMKHSLKVTFILRNH